MKRMISVILTVALMLSFAGECLADTNYSSMADSQYFACLGERPYYYMKDGKNRAEAVWITLLELVELFDIDINYLDLYGEVGKIKIGYSYSSSSYLTITNSRVLCIQIPTNDKNEVCFVMWDSSDNTIWVRFGTGYRMAEAQTVSQDTLWAMYDYLFG